jgi:4-hydroxybenzoate polyprenyltransferase
MNFMTFKKISGFLKLEHSLFSLPLLFAGAALALKTQGKAPWLLPPAVLAWIVLAGTGARTCALALNRLLDARLDARNPRTAGRELPSGKMTSAQGWGIAALGLLLYGLAAWKLGPGCLRLSPIPLAVFVLYPLMKRFTFLAHAGVGMGLALAPLGGYVALAQGFPSTPGPWLLAGFTFCWVAGFDVLYALQDEAFDRREGLHSIPSRFGPKVSRVVSAVLHLTALAFLVGLGRSVFSSGLPTLLSLVPTALLLGAEHQLGASLEPNAAFFKVNAWIGFCVLFFVLVTVR